MGKGVGTAIIQLVFLASRSANEMLYKICLGSNGIQILQTILLKIQLCEIITAQCACHENMTYFVSLYEKRSI